MSIDMEEIVTDPQGARRRIRKCRWGSSQSTGYEFEQGEEIHICMDRREAEFERRMAEACVYAEAKLWELGPNPADVGRWTAAIVEHGDEEGYEIKVHAGGHSRHHEVRKYLPKDGIARIMECHNCCIGKYKCVFVKTEIVKRWYTEGANIIAMLDIAGTKRMLRKAETTAGKKTIIDKVQAMQRSVYEWSLHREKAGDGNDRILCMGDSVFVERDQVFGMVSDEEREPRVPGDYDPEKFIREVLDLRRTIATVTGQPTYCIVTESTAVNIGPNEEKVKRGKLEKTEIIYWPSLGDGIQRALAIEEWAKRAIKQARHKQSEVYLEEDVLTALQLWGWGTRRKHHEYWSSGKGTERYAVFEYAEDLIRELDLTQEMRRRLTYEHEV